MKLSLTRVLLIFCLLFWGTGVWSAAADRSSFEDWKPVAMHYLDSKQTAPTTRITVYPPDIALDMPACPSLEAFSPLGAKTQGLTSVGVRCLGPKPWVLYLKARVEVLGQYLTARGTLAPNHVIEERDIDVVEGDLSGLPPNAVLDKRDLIGRVVALTVSSGQLWRSEHVRKPFVIQAGQSVQLRVLGAGFQVSGEGIALSNVSEGQLIQVRTPKGSLVSGIAHSGAWVELRL